MKSSCVPRILPLLLTPLLGPLASACSNAEMPRSYSMRDSAGVQIVETHREAWDETHRWRVAPSPKLEIGVRDGEETIQFFGVTDALRLSDGRIVVLNNGTRSIRIFSPEGQLIREFGRDGEGPGEFRTLSSVHALSGDTLLVWDGRRRVFSVLTASGEFVRSQRLTWAGSEQLVGIRPLPDGRVLVKTYAGPFTGGGDPGQGIHRSTAPLLLFGRDGTLLDTIGVFPNAESAVMEISGSPAYTVPPFDKNFFFDVRGSSIILGTAERMEVSVWDVESGTKAVFRSPDFELSVTQNDRDWYRQRMLETSPSPEAREEAEMLLEKVPFPEFRAAFTNLCVDPVGNIWLRTGRHLYYYAPAREWTVLSPDGAFLGRVSLPPDFAVLNFGPDDLLGVWKDEVGAEFIRVYALEKPGA
jgi:hypothetical protein